ncbi:MAG: hypothetical protein H8D96_13440 [Desulfobacterales bacterium]|uniref:DUF1573 domain-containing protein n=1 Tax=Candidatus Desulfatibia vada TaxID=2841696 RepID=A0A8J6TQW4_9BACT|nr:hypothetical protein [Candidatus Desulfatibia vada]MBL6971203.1 hypothetical protein [Desulfobacterales bacterium]
MKVNTSGYGGRKIRESARIQTNDKTRPGLSVTVTGLVKKFADVRPERIRLVGPAGTLLVAEVEITPRKEYPFIVRNVKAKSGRFIKSELKERCTDGRNRCVVRVENTRVDKGRYVDSILVQTDSPLRREIPVYVIGVIQ